MHDHLQRGGGGELQGGIGPAAELLVRVDVVVEEEADDIMASFPKKAEGVDGAGTAAYVEQDRHGTHSTLPGPAMASPSTAAKNILTNRTHFVFNVLAFFCGKLPH
jgi:hypothetical protein